MSNSFKFLVVALLISCTFFYSHYEKRKVDELTMDTGYVLKSVPEFDGTFLSDSSPMNSLKVVSSYPGTFIHFWGTWCAPCETEFPDLLEFANKLAEKNLHFMLVAINDKPKKVKAFLKRFKNLPKNVSIVVKEDTSLMARFGTFKVPETYLFGSGGSLLTKYVGPQDWKNKSYVRQIDRLVFNQKEKLKNIETH